MSDDEFYYEDDDDWYWYEEDDTGVGVSIILSLFKTIAYKMVR